MGMDSDKGFAKGTKKFKVMLQQNLKGLRVDGFDAREAVKGPGDRRLSRHPFKVEYWDRYPAGLPFKKHGRGGVARHHSVLYS